MRILLGSAGRVRRLETTFEELLRDCTLPLWRFCGPVFLGPTTPALSSPSSGPSVAPVPGSPQAHPRPGALLTCDGVGWCFPTVWELSQLLHLPRAKFSPDWRVPMHRLGRGLVERT